DIAGLLKYDYRIADETTAQLQYKLSPFLIPGLDAHLLVFINGRWSPDLSEIREEKDEGVVISSLKTALENRHPALEGKLSRVADFREDTFTALNTAFALDGVFVFVPAGKTIAKPVHIINLAIPGEKPFQSHPRNLFILEEGSSATIIESHEHAGSGVYLQNVVGEITIGDKAELKHYRIQNESRESYRISTMQVELGRECRYTGLGLDLGGALVRNNTNLLIGGEYSEANLYGFYLVSGRQHIDNHTNIDHAAPNCDSNELFKGILADKARGVFSGTIYVRRDAQKTNAFQSNKNLLLSEEAEIDSKPQLKIFADDVKCSHGATIGQLDEEALFYLRQRGLSISEANTMLRYAFAADVFNRIELAPLKEYADQKVNKRILNEISAG
ncbi:MAG: Fe-S cluster assembly protein SufD, partial [Calditrichia bacterium]